MLAHELAKELLSQPNLPVHFAYDYGDHWRTQVAPEVEKVEIGSVDYSEYHRMPKVVAMLDDYTEEDEDNLGNEVVILQ